MLIVMVQVVVGLTVEVGDSSSERSCGTATVTATVTAINGGDSLQ